MINSSSWIPAPARTEVRAGFEVLLGNGGARCQPLRASARTTWLGWQTLPKRGLCRGRKGSEWVGVAHRRHEAVLYRERLQSRHLGAGGLRPRKGIGLEGREREVFVNPCWLPAALRTSGSLFLPGPASPGYLGCAVLRAERCLFLF